MYDYFNGVGCFLVNFHINIYFKQSDQNNSGIYSNNIFRHDTKRQYCIKKKQ